MNVISTGNTSPLAQELPRRRQSLAMLLREADLQFAVLWHAPTVCYLTGNEIPGRNAIVLTADGAATVICDEYDMYNFETLDDDLTLLPYPYHESLFDHVATYLGEVAPPVEAVGIELAELHHTAASKLHQSRSGAELAGVDHLVAKQRLVKTVTELEQIRGAAAAVEAAYGGVQELLVNATTERKIAERIYAELIRAGSDYVASQPYVKSGPRAFHTHARWGDRTIDPADHVLLELGASVHRYHAALMRSRPPTNHSRDFGRALDAVVAGRDAYLAALRPGISAAELHAAHLAALEGFGARSWNRHPSGYSLGIAFPPYWGELPLLTITVDAEQVLKAGMVLHLISGLTAPEADIPHIGLSECVLVTESGCERLIEVPEFL